jgi:hypothetical protein
MLISFYEKIFFVGEFERLLNANLNLQELILLKKSWIIHFANSIWELKNNQNE